VKVIENFVPVYYQLAEDLKRQIESGALKPGDVIPSESQLGVEYGISRMTVRRGLALLLESGLIETARGKGNYVAKPRLQQATLTFEEDALVNNKKAEFKFIEVKRVPAESEIAVMLNIPEGTKVFTIRRLIRSDRDPVGIDIKYIPYLKGKPMLENEIEYAYFPDIVARHTDVMIYKIERRIMAASLQAGEAELLKTVAGHPALCVIQVIYARDEKPLGVSKTTYRGEAYELRTASFPYSGS
jgi:GntR family transcriptional regulator